MSFKQSVLVGILMLAGVLLFFAALSLLESFFGTAQFIVLLWAVIAYGAWRSGILHDLFGDDDTSDEEDYV